MGKENPQGPLLFAKAYIIVLKNKRLFPHGEGTDKHAFLCHVTKSRNSYIQCT